MIIFSMFSLLLFFQLHAKVQIICDKKIQSYILKKKYLDIKYFSLSLQLIK